MIISASRRTDIPAFYSDWLFNRIKEGYVYVRNPMSFHQVSKVNLSPDDVDGMVFWTKNPRPMMERLGELDGYSFYFQFTLNPYGPDIETGVPGKGKEVIKTFIELSEKIGPERLIWRYDPIILSEKYSLEYHRKYFEKLAGSLSGSFSRCVISFVDKYQKNAKFFLDNGIRELNSGQIAAAAEIIAETARKYNIPVASCAEAADLSRYGINHSSCVDKEMAERLSGRKINVKKDKNQRRECGCAESVDIGAYNSCLHGCGYCYANYSMNMVRKNYLSYDPDSPILCGTISGEDRITERRSSSAAGNGDAQTNLFDGQYAGSVTK